MYSARIDGEPTTFGTSGLLYRSNKVMYDRKTNTLWSQLLGKPIVGELVGGGMELEALPVALTTWGEWLAEHPNTGVMSPRTGYYSPARYEREDDPRSIYFDYRQDADTMFPVWDRDSILPPKREVLGLAVDGVHKAYPIDALQRLRLVNDSVNGADMVVIASAGSLDALAFRGDGREFSLPPNAPDSLPRMLIDADGAEWRVTRDALVNAADPSQTLPAHPSNVMFWFAWRITYPNTLLFQAPP